jgi:transposase
MGKIKKLELTDAKRVHLEKGFRHGTSHCFRMRCRAILLKADGLSSAKTGEQTEMSLVSVNAWVNRFLSEGITGLQTRAGRGRKPVMDCSDEAAVRRAIEQDRQSVSKAKASWQESTGKEASDLTFKRFLSSLAQGIDV